MSLYRYGKFSPKIGEKCFVAPDASIIGRVHSGINSSIWFSVVARGDVNQISIGENTNIQDLSILHVTYERPLLIGDGVTIGHSVTLHACTIENYCLIGMGATILDGATIGKNSVVAGGSVCPPGKIYPPYSMIMGNPAKVTRELREEEIVEYGNHYKSYIKMKNDYLDSSIFEPL